MLDLARLYTGEKAEVVNRRLIGGIMVKLVWLVLAKLRASSRGKTRGASVILHEWV